MDHLLQSAASDIQRIWRGHWCRKRTTRYWGAQIHHQPAHAHQQVSGPERELMELCANVGWKAHLLADGQQIECRVGHAIRGSAAGMRHILHVRGIGQEGWDGTETGPGSFESEDALREIFEAFGPFVEAKVNHRIAYGKHGRLENTSYGLVTMGNAEAVETALAEPKIMAGKTRLTVTRYNKERAASSTGRMKRIEGRSVPTTFSISSCAPFAHT